MRPSAIFTLFVPVLIVLAACSSAPDSPAPFDDAPSLTFTQVLGLVSADVAGPVSYTDWSALNHRVTGFARSTTTPSWVRDAAEFRKAVGVGPADSAWQVHFALDDHGVETITQWTDGARLAQIVGSLKSHGWTESTRGSWRALERSEPLTDIGWTWANPMDFLLDEKRGLLVQYTRGSDVLLPGARSVLDRPGVRAAVSQTPSPVTGQVRDGASACPTYGLAQLSPRPPESFIRQYVEAVGRLGTVSAVSVAVTRPDGRSGVVAVTVGSARQARGELSARQNASRHLPSADPAVRVSGGRAHGSVDSFALDSTSPLDLVDLIDDSALGADSCGIR